MSSVERSSHKREVYGTQAARGGGRDILSTLPPELLDHIFTQVRLESQKPGIGAISKTLLPYTRSTRFHTLRVNSYASLRHLCRVLREDERLGIYVVQLFVRLGDDDWNRDDRGLSESVVGVSNDDLLHLFSTLTSIELLSLDSTPCIALFLSDWFAHSCLPSSWSRALRSIEALHIKGRGCASSPHVVAMISYFYNLSSLSLVDKGHQAGIDLNPFLLAAPAGVDYLSISLPGSNRDEDRLFPIDTTLTRFTQLYGLTIDHSATGAALYDVLRELPLVVLTFGPWSRPNGQQLLTLIEGPEAIETLRSLDLFNVTGLVGDWMIDHPAAHEPLYSYEPRYEGWTFPAWTEEFDEDDAREIEEVARSAEASLSGTVHDALGAVDTYWRQVTLLQESRVV